MEALSRVEIITNYTKIEELKNSLVKFGISGMTVLQALGCGKQLGTQEFEEEQDHKEPVLLPKELVLIILPTKDVERFIKFVTEELYTGHIGDGKIFISDISNVVRIRTGDQGINAIQ